MEIKDAINSLGKGLAQLYVYKREKLIKDEEFDDKLSELKNIIRYLNNRD